MQGNYKNKAYPLRIDNDLMETVKHIAEMEDRTTNKQIEKVLREWVQTYESKKESPV